MTAHLPTYLYGAPSTDLVEWPPEAIPVSPLTPGGTDLATLAPGSAGRIVMLAPAGAIERRYAVALALRALASHGELVVLAPKDRGGARLAKELSGFGCTFEETSRRHHRICRLVTKGPLEGLAEALAAGGPRKLEALQMWSQPGVFSWDRLDPGTAFLISQLPRLSGLGADFGCGIGVLAKAVLASEAVTRLELIDIDARAIAAAARNLDDPRVRLHWADVRTGPLLSNLDFVVCNPPFHAAGEEDRALGQAFIRRAHSVLKPGGVLWLVANRHLPYEQVLREAFAHTHPRGEAKGFKIYEARK